MGSPFNPARNGKCKVRFTLNVYMIFWLPSGSRCPWRIPWSTDGKCWDRTCGSFRGCWSKPGWKIETKIIIISTWTWRHGVEQTCADPYYDLIRNVQRLFLYILVLNYEVKGMKADIYQNREPCPYLRGCEYQRSEKPILSARKF